MAARTFIHLALRVADLDASVAFYTKYAPLDVVHRRDDRGGGRTVWLHDGRHRFVLVLIEPGRASPLTTVLRRIAQGISRYVSRPAHLGIPCASRAEVDRFSQLAERDGRLLRAANDAGPVVGYYAMLCDPDGYNLELSHGQEVGMPADTPEHSQAD